MGKCPVLLSEPRSSSCDAVSKVQVGTMTAKYDECIMIMRYNTTSRVCHIVIFFLTDCLFLWLEGCPGDCARGSFQGRSRWRSYVLPKLQALGQSMCSMEVHRSVEPDGQYEGAVCG